MLSTHYTFSARQARDFLDAIGEDLSQLKPLVQQWIDYYRTVAQPAIFKAHEGGAATGGGGHGHPQWQALSSAYIASSEKRTSPHPEDILQLTGDFRRDLTEGTEFTYQHISEVNGNIEARFGTLRKYPVYAGAADGGPRQAMYLTAETIKQLDAITNHFISEIIVKERTKHASELAEQARHIASIVKP